MRASNLSWTAPCPFPSVLFLEQGERTSTPLYPLISCIPESHGFAVRSIHAYLTHTRHNGDPKRQANSALTAHSQTTASKSSLCSQQHATGRCHESGPHTRKLSFKIHFNIIPEVLIPLRPYDQNPASIDQHVFILELAVGLTTTTKH